MRSEVQALPKLFLERLRKVIPVHKFDSIANTFSDSKPTTFRINTLKAGAHCNTPVQEELQHQGFRLEKVSWYSEAFILRSGRLKDLEKTEVYQKGGICVQNLSSMIPPLVLEPKPGEKVLDLAAAPGSKTTQLACLMNGKGRIVANDNNEIRFARLAANVALQGARNVELMRSYGESAGKKFPEQFDRVLVDAPCSAEGRFDVHEPSSYRYWNPKKIQDIAKIQKKLLFSGLAALKEGGVLVYSTCTFAPEENEAVINEALGKFGDAVQVEPVGFSISNQMSGLAVWEKVNFHASVKKAVRILPTSEMEGFFIARIKKRKRFVDIK
jgi:16S rRNA (cytosine1407-C5)-methyltransferase